MLNDTTPNLDAHRNRALIFENAYSCSTNTDPSLTSIFTGKYPVHTGIHNHGARLTAKELQLASSLPYFSETLRENGYMTTAIDVSDRWHSKGFDEYLIQTKSNLYGLGSFGNEILDRFHAYDLFFALISKAIPPGRLPTGTRETFLILRPKSATPLRAPIHLSSAVYASPVY